MNRTRFWVGVAPLGAEPHCVNQSRCAARMPTMIPPSTASRPRPPYALAQANPRPMSMENDLAKDPVQASAAMREPVVPTAADAGAACWRREAFG